MEIPLHSKHCVPCEGGVAPFTTSQVQEYLKKVGKGWKSINSNTKIEKTFNCINFKAVIAFVNEIADIAEYEGHHPDLNIHHYNKLTITLWTHAIKGLSENDFIMASKIEAIELGL